MAAPRRLTPGRARRSRTPDRDPEWGTWLALGLILLLAAVLRFAGSGWGANYYLHPDERFMTMVVTGVSWPATLSSYFDSATSPLNPYNAGFDAYVYGTFPLFLAKALGFLTGDIVYGSAHLPGRWLSALADTGTVALAFWIGRRLFSTTAGLLAALLLALTPLHIQNAHFFATDAVAAFLVVAAFAAVLRSTDSSRWRWVGLAGVCVGLAAASKPNLAIAAGFLFIPALEQVRAGGVASLRPRVDWRAIVGSPVGRALGALAIAGLAFRIAQPYAFAGPHLWNLTLDPRWTDTLDYWRQVQRGSIDLPPSVQWADRPPLLFTLDNLVRWGMGPALGLAALLALGWYGLRMLLARRWPRWWLLAMVLWVVFHLVLYGTGFVKAQRYLLLAYPFLIVLAAGWLDTLPERLRDTGWRPGPGVARRLRVTLIALVALGTVVSGVAMASVYQREHTRVVASEWIFANVPPGSVIASEHWDDGLPLLLPGQPIDAYRFAEIAGYDPDSQQKLSRLIGQLQRTDYIVLSSDRLAETIPRLPDRYPMMQGYYAALQNGTLGFEQVASFTSPPTFLGIELDDRGAEESLTVYDHPHVRIYRKTAAFSAHEAWYLLDSALGDGGVPRRSIDPTEAQLMLTDAERERVTSGGTWSEIVDTGLPTGVVVVLWYLLLQLAALAAVPVLWRLLTALPDRGYAIAKTVGILVVGWGVWILGSTNLLQIGRPAIALVLLLALGAGLAMTFGQWRAVVADLRSRWRWVVATELLFGVAFLGMLWLRSRNPDLWLPGRGGEKPMELGILAALLRSDGFPPHDPWFAGGVLHYYYLGYVPWAALARLLGIAPELAFNLALPSLFALLLVSTWSAAAALLGAMGRSRAGWRPILLALPAPLLVALVGNLDFVRRLGRGEWGGSPPPGWAEAIGEPGLVLIGIWRALTESRDLPPDAYWSPTRVILGTINEFPYFSFLFGDLHAHVLAMPVVAAIFVVAVALATGPACCHGTGVLATLGGWRRALALALLGGFLSGTLLGTNPWDYPPAVALIIAAAGMRLLAAARAPWRSVRDLAMFALALVAIGRLLHWPFLDRYGALTPETLPALEATALRDYLAIHGLPLLAIAGYLVLSLMQAGVSLSRSGRWGRESAILALVTTVTVFALAFVLGDTRLFLFAGLLAVVLAGVSRIRHPAHLTLLGMVGLALGMGLVAEQVRFANDVGRMNLVFKLYLHAWQLLAVAAAVSVVIVLGSVAPRPRRDPVGYIAGFATRTWVVALAVLLVGALAYPILTTSLRLSDRVAALPPTLDGLAYMDHAEFAEGLDGGEFTEITTAGDRAAIAWLRDHVSGTPVILEAQLPAYRWGGRISSATGLPAVLGWTWHEIQQRPGHQAAIEERVEDVAEIYVSPHDLTAVLPLLERYGVRYIVVGELERALYPATGLAKFERAAGDGTLEVVHDAQGVTIYALDPALAD